MVNKDTQEKLRAKYNPDDSTLRKAQLRMLEMMTFIKNVCDEHNIDYWLDAGTLLGAKRHGGFIPWDDDADLGMKFEDIGKLKDILLHENPSSEFVIQCRESDEGYFGSWIVLRDLKSEYLQDGELHNMRKYRGLQVDIFPYENVNDFLWKSAKLFNYVLIIGPILNRYKLGFLRKYLAKSYKFLYGILFPNIRRSFKGNKSCYRLSYGNYFKSKHDKKNIETLSEITFEGQTFKCPAYVDDYLKESYGNWEKIPEENNIITHNVNVIFK